MDGEDHLNGCGRTEYAVSDIDDSVHRFGVCGGLGHKLVEHVVLVACRGLPTAEDVVCLA